MQARARFMLAVVVLFLLMTGPFLLTALIVWVETEGEARDLLLKVLSPHLTLGTLLTAMGFAAGVGVVRVLFRQYVQGLLRMSENLRLMLGANRGFRVHPEGPPEVQQLAVATNELASQRDVLLQDVEAQIGRAKASVELEKDRLAALMSELTQSVVVCNLDGRVLLYNNRARAQFRALSDAPGVAGGGELIGLGRSIYGVFERNLIAHALDTIQQRLRRGAAQAQANFVTTTRAGQLLRVQMAPVLSLAAPALVAAESTAVAAGSVTGVQQNAAAEGDGAGNAGGGASPAAPEVAAAAVTSERTLTGFILMLDNITRNFETESRRDQMLHNLTEGNRASLANVRAAADMLEFEDLTDEMRTRFRKVVRDEVQAMSQRLDHTANEFADSLKARWPLEEMLGADLIAAAQRRIEARIGLPTKLEEVDESLWVKVDSFSLIQAITYLASRLSDEFEVREVRFRLSAAGRLVHLDLIWSGQAMSTETVMSWELEPMKIEDESSPLTVRDVVDRHDGEMWLEREKVRHRAFFRILLPAATPQEQAEAETYLRGESRPEYYDFDLFAWSEKSHELDDRLLSELSYTVFDTETTGLNPSQGDEIIQVGATRILNGKLLRAESFEQLVDPERPLAPESAKIHGITSEMLRGQPTIDKVLPAFHAFAADTVLIAHNAAFDMRFLQLKEEQTGLRFDHPVIDTLLLSAVVHPNQESHRLEAIAERLGLTIVGRHTALGDAIVTAEVFLKLIPLLAEKGIRTLRDAREAAEKTYYARVKY
ncbi:MAG TPA: exonuclease domain-containing protein [Thauera aminoaromatica]|jgi:DNA polymerase-3 subunit epsilon|uniref:DNA-directed DNA polymerase n=1 Tax=Thauera aminoaromatica S2 TaxID=1234381 RepID=N6Z1S9_THASP|nr:exonuclease domain-containing protein [Thauera aminoaromatica]ENO88562.1 DNA polymerase III subunit epsilon [Thauera aminoaromatica S2]OPZ04285.1 MAG: DNA polymerase III PolC-type [Alphaproteobacteria bacterium ADurb.BinA305]HNC67027.1 exonuclease domain-containing protein [Thauera aminoaromatica]